MKETLRGYIAAIIYRNKDNLYTVFELNAEGKALTCTGYPAAISEGESVELKGEMVVHPVYGEQFRAEDFRLVEPRGSEAVLRYLSSGAIKGIGNSLAARIVKKFGDDTMRVLDEEPQRLSEIRGISDRMARDFSKQLEEKRDLRDAMIFLQKYGLSGQRALRIWETYGVQMYSILKENPYRLAEDIEGIGFATADAIAARAGILPDSDFRIRSGILYVLSENLQAGSSYMRESRLTEQTAFLLRIPEEPIRIQLENLAVERKVRILTSEDGALQVYLTRAYRLEQEIAGKLLELERAPVSSFDEEEIDGRIRKIEKEEEIELDNLQRDAVCKSVTRGVLLLCGGPGTGKTTTINTIIRMFLNDTRSVVLAAPTGRAAKRMTEATGYEAMTLHRLLGYKAPAGEEEKDSAVKRVEGWHFEKDEDNPLEADVVIVDEMSMVDLYLFHALLQALSPGTRLIMVGDTNQLPSVGPGRIFGDLTESGRFCSITLQKIFRQAQASDIVMNAHRILRGEPLRLDNHSRDFFFLERSEIPVIYKHMVELIRDKLPQYIHGTAADIQVLTPMKKGPLGAIRLNEVLQSVLNPKEAGKKECISHGEIFRVGDKVMQTRNNYQMEWEVPGPFGIPQEKGNGIFNGDFGRVMEIDVERSEAIVGFDENRMVHYPFSELEDLELAYAITVHKSQGSEYPAVILPLLGGPQPLLNRNLLYTALTRARQCVVILGSRATLEQMENNVQQNDRNTGLKDRILEFGTG